MTRTRTTLVTGACAALLALAGATAAIAQSAPSPAPATATEQAAHPSHDGARARHRAMTPEQRQQMRQQRAQAFKQKLALTAQQEPAWAAFQQAMQPGQQHARLDGGQGQDWKQLSTPERLDRMRALQTQRAAEFDRRAEATKVFYASLQPEQQKTFDAEGARMFSRFGHGMHGQHGKHAGHHAHGKRGAAPQGQPQPQ